MVLPAGRFVAADFFTGVAFLEAALPDADFAAFFAGVDFFAGAAFFPGALLFTVAGFFPGGALARLAAAAREARSDCPTLTSAAFCRAWIDCRSAGEYMSTGVAGSVSIMASSACVPRRSR